MFAEPYFVEHAHGLGAFLGSLVGSAGERLAATKRAAEDKIPSFRRDPIRVAVMRVDAEADAMIAGGCVHIAQLERRIAGGAVEAHAAQIQQRMAAHAAAEPYAEAWLLPDLGQRTEFCVVGIKPLVETVFSRRHGGGIEPYWIANRASDTVDIHR